jgi:2-(1,2-epoxy-1,2-dihydrophenyl)acetyl-CoA isomerase
MRLSIDDGLAEIVFDSPDTLNALKPVEVEEFAGYLQQLREREARAVLLRAEGKSFSVGRDLNTMSPEDDVAATLRGFNSVFEEWHHLPLPTVAAVQGHCLGLGAGFALTADVVVVGESAKFGSPLGKLGGTADCGFHSVAVRAFGVQIAKDLLLSGRFVDGREAERRGLVARCVPDADLQAHAADLARDLAKGPTAAHALSLALVDRIADGLSFAQSLDAEAEALGASYATQDFAEGYAAFFAKREPHFTGR